MHSISDIIKLDSDNIRGVKKGLVDVHFKDNMDEQIFIELMTNLYKMKPLTFYSHDNEFAKKSTSGYLKIAEIFMFDAGTFSFVLL